MLHSYWAPSTKSTYLRVKKHASLSAVKELETTASMRQMKTFQSEPRSPTPNSSGKLETKRAGSEKWRWWEGMFSNHLSSDRSGWGNWPLVSSLACLLKVAATPPSSSLSLSTDFFRAKQGQPSMCLLVTPLGDPDSQREVGGSREAAGVMVGRLSSFPPPALPTLVWFPAAPQPAMPPGAKPHVPSGKYI